MAAASFSLAGIALPDTLRCFQRALQSIKIEHGWLYFKLQKQFSVWVSFDFYEQNYNM